MEFNEKLQQLRKQQGITQQELADALFVSRTAVSKWESGRGYPGIDSLKAIAKFFSVSIDSLLSGEEALTLAEEDGKQKEKHLTDLVFGLLDCSAALFFFLPLFGQWTDGVLHEVSLPALTGVSPYLRAAYLAAAAAVILCGVLTLALQGARIPLWERKKNGLSLILHGAATLFFILGRQPNAAAVLFIFLAIKVLLTVKKR